jgi:hypothetical protein
VKHYSTEEVYNTHRKLHSKIHPERNKLIIILLAPWPPSPTSSSSHSLESGGLNIEHYQRERRAYRLVKSGQKTSNLQGTQRQSRYILDHQQDKNKRNDIAGLLVEHLTEALVRNLDNRIFESAASPIN